MEAFDVDTFLRTRVAPHLEELGRLRTRALLLYVASIGLLVFSIGVFLGARDAWPLPGIAGMAMAAVTLLFGASAQSELRRTFKQVVMRQLLAAAYPGLRYDPDACISESLYEASGIFQKSYDSYEGDDFVSGRVGETDVCFSELHTQYKTVTRDSKGNTTTHWHTIFRGILFRADFHKHFAGTTFVLPDHAQGLLGDWLGQGLQALTASHGGLVKLEDPRFEQVFVTYASDQQEARYILTPSLMERMLELRARFGVATSFSFVDGCVHVALATGQAHFEPSLWSSYTTDGVRKHLSLIRAVLGIVEDLSLNQRIWTKR